MPTTDNRRCTDITSGKAWLFSVLCVLAMASAAQAQQPTSQVLAFTGATPGQPDGPVAVRLRLYDADAAGTFLFEETQTVMVVGERFTVRVGDATVGGVPATLFRDNASLWIAFALDSAPDIEIGARTALTSGGYAHAAALVAGPMVRTVNGLVGDVVLAEGPNVTITPTGNTLTIAAPNALTGVTHDSTLSGEGTGGAPLGVAAPLQLMSNSSAPTLAGSNGGAGSGVRGTSTIGTGVFGTGGEGPGVLGSSSTGFGRGVQGLSTSGTGVQGDSTSGKGVEGRSVNGTGVEGQNTFTTPLATAAGVKGTSTSVDGTGVWGEGGGRGLFGFSENGSGVVAFSRSGRAGFFDGRVVVTGFLEKRGGGFKIDHPQHPAEKYLVHSFVESPDMKNIYDGIVTTDARGEAVVTLPDYFEALNRDFRYQLTVIGAFCQAIVASKVKDNRFMIKTDKPDVEVSWQVTGIRHDAWAEANRPQVEQDKRATERGFYLDPTLFGQSEERRIEWARHPELMKHQKEERERLAAESRKELATTKR